MCVCVCLIKSGYENGVYVFVSNQVFVLFRIGREVITVVRDNKAESLGYRMEGAKARKKTKLRKKLAKWCAYGPF